uniref:Kelch-like family member 33 n=1 Tax=Sphaeramia orbicularis TaxID=375764 RepID=A0A673C8H2_9TELE
MESERDGDMEGSGMEQEKQEEGGEEVEKQHEHELNEENHLEEHLQQNQEPTGQEDLSDLLEFVDGKVHRVILAASSDYFRAMFTLGMKESNQPFVNLPFLLASELEVLIGCSYSGILALSWSCVFEITSTALQLQYQPALSMCLNFLQQEINPQSCLDVASFANAYGMVQLLEVAEDFVLRQFQKVACTSKFKDLPAKQLLKYLNSLSLCVPSELVVFRAVVSWIQAKPKIRLRLAKELMKTIHFPLMTFKEFKEVRNQNMWSEHSLKELYETIFEDFCSIEVAPQNQCRIYLPKESLVLIGGDQISEDLGTRSISRDLWFGNSLRNHMGIKKAMEWRKLGEMPDPARFEKQMCIFNLSSFKQMFHCQYDPLRNNWETLAEMRERRCSFSVVVLDGKIYAIGGHCDPEYRDSVERYCPATNSWSYTCPLDLPLSGHVAKVLQGQIFISGGLNNDYLCLASTFLYHPERGSTYLDNMSKPRAYHCMETLGGCLYVAGGMTTHDNVNATDQLACEMYNPAADSWTSFPPLPVPHMGAGSAVLEGKFYVLGGYSQEDYSDMKMVHRYDPATQQWENMVTNREVPYGLKLLERNKSLLYQSDVDKDENEGNFIHNFYKF